MQNTKQIILSASLIAVFILFVVYERQNKDSSVSTAITQTLATNVDKTSSITLATQLETPAQAAPKPASTPTPTQVAIRLTPSPIPVSSVTRYKEGSYTGKVADAYYGNLQVATVISGGKIVDVKFLQYPNDQDESLEISNRSMPKLKSEALSSQSANVDIISGATQTSEAFNESLADTLLQAKA